MKFLMLILCITTLCIPTNTSATQKNTYSTSHRGNITSYTINEDVVSYTNNKNDKNFINQIRLKYNGLTDESVVNTSLNQQNYIEVLNYLWTEPDMKKRLQWLENRVAESHPILMFELGENYYYQDPTLDTYITKTMPWILAGYRRTWLDTVCTSDQSVRAAPEFLLASYQTIILNDLKIRYSQKELEDYVNVHSHDLMKNILATLRIVMAPFVKTGNMKLPSPKWVFAHGLRAFTGEKNTIADKEFEKLRRKEAENFLKQADALEQSIKK